MIHQGVPALPGAPRWVVPTSGTFPTPFSSPFLFSQDKKSLYTSRTYRPPYHGEIFCSSFLLFSDRSMAALSSSKDKFFERVINSYLSEVMKHPQTIEMREGVLHIRDVQGPKGKGTVEARLEAMEQEVFKCQGMVERGLNAN